MIKEAIRCKGCLRVVETYKGEMEGKEVEVQVISKVKGRKLRCKYLKGKFLAKRKIFLCTGCQEYVAAGFFLIEKWPYNYEFF